MSSGLHIEMQGRRTPILPFMLLPFLVLVICPRLDAQQSQEFDTLVSKVAASIQDSSRKLPSTPTVLVLDFDEQLERTAYPQVPPVPLAKVGTPSELGHALAIQFAEALQKQARGFIVLNASDLQQAVQHLNLPQEVLLSRPAMKCYAAEFGATIYVEGRMEYAPDGVVLDVDLWPVKDHRESIWGTRTILPVTPAMMDLAAKAAPPVPPIAIHETKVWVSRDHPPLNDEKVVHFTDAGYKLPSCAIGKCPPPGISDDAAVFHLQGTIRLSVQILADRSVSKISLIDGLPCGMTDRAFETVEHWKFKPATGPDGKPVASEVLEEITFQMY